MDKKTLFDQIDKQYSDSSKEFIKTAYFFAEKAHDKQLRASGEPYIIHPTEVASILVSLKMDPDTIAAALLHDVLEDTPTTREEIIEKFGENVLNLVESVTKLDSINFQNKKDNEAQSLKKMLFAMAKDIRVLMIKLADRLHNMRSLASLSEERRIAISQETLDIYAPLAGRLGISNIKCELEDLSMMYIMPEKYNELLKLSQKATFERKGFIDEVVGRIKEKLDELGIKGEINGRKKHIYSIYRKMLRHNCTFDEIYDLIAVRIIVETKQDCYSMLGAVHTMWKPMPGRFKDYIATPKPNFYQSLHTTVFSKGGAPFEIQIRTYDMHNIAEYGIAAHWKYKEGIIKTDKFQEKLAWLREMLDVQKDVNDSDEFMDHLKIDLFTDEVFVFTPGGDIIDLPMGATPIDFAYSIHSAVGNKCVGAKVNSKIAPLNTVLNTGDMVEIITSNASKGPSRDWLKTVKTSSAKAKIRSFFKKEMQEDNIKRGKEIIEHEAKRRGYELSELYQKNWIDAVLEKYSLSSIEDMYASVGYGGITVNQVLAKLIDAYKKSVKNKTEFINGETKRREPVNNVLVKGYDNFLIRMGRCCNPLPNDEIIGYISRGRGVAIHRKDCPNIKKIEQERLIEANWSGVNNTAFVASLKIIAEYRTGVFSQITSIISNCNFPLVSANMKADRDKLMTVINVSVEIRSAEDLTALIQKIESAPYVREIHRTVNG